ncbi:hypothetical protein AJ78_05851 [Emergomyces pasteurianus Ep9510]|uniref:CFEM domain-containing protein n=1 Tax=Emergomyces pasteurianus Ep9510 TaxID=1447872 RepID=A0A1J9QC47_9EURO|nr:hypothetical protein AJ78_05851 [Emergomyces pasteurianus Ep9510]
MRLSIAAVASLLALASAQGLGGLPDCAKNCAGSAIPQECGLDVKCICTAKTFLDAITCCVAKACNADDQKKTISFAKGICGTVGVTNIPDAAICATGSTTGTGTATGTPTGTRSGTTASGSPTSTGEGGAKTGSSSTAPPKPTGIGGTTGGAGGPAPSQKPDKGAGSRIGAGMGMGAAAVGAGLAMGVLGIL